MSRKNQRAGDNEATTEPVGYPVPDEGGPEEHTPEPKRDVKRRAGLDPEIQALARLDRILEPLNDEQCQRCVLWLMQKYMGGVVTSVRPNPGSVQPIPVSER